MKATDCAAAAAVQKKHAANAARRKKCVFLATCVPWRGFTANRILDCERDAILPEAECAPAYDFLPSPAADQGTVSVA